ncbi:MAG: sel1 repeat family protein [Candidatus Thiothrix singaporensis]|uniref:Sel1 repeat family protein n=1 Tax=Candidatus Thiothrix singaporensis TaxID=2799669 RepID=A0A7L6AY62_9GAMM|nr:MAG: sel1 repeat family protein [Candidatus Thiothrix singaporensis]
MLYEDGRGVTQNFKQAAYWYDKAAKAGFSEAQNNLGVLFVLGNGVKKTPSALPSCSQTPPARAMRMRNVIWICCVTTNFRCFCTIDTSLMHTKSPILRLCGNGFLTIPCF